MFEDAEERINKISELQARLQGMVQRAETALFDMMMIYFTALRDNPIIFRRLWRDFAKSNWTPTLQQFTLDMRTVLALNREYFEKTRSLRPVKKIVDTIDGHVLERFGLDKSGKVITDGYIDTLLSDQTTKRQIQQFFYGARARKDNARLMVEMREMLKGVGDGGGLASRFFYNYVYDTYQQADRMAQNQYADKLELPAAIYTGGLIENSRPFCIERNSRVFTREEIALFGTPDDEFEGYSDKSIGKFSGKPKAGYDPFTMCGGHGCRHHLSWILGEYAVRRDKSLILVGGKLIRVE